MYLFSAFAKSFTPHFIRDFRERWSLGKGIGYWFFWWFIFALIFSTIAGIVGGHFAKIAIDVGQEYLSDFVIEFQDGKLVSTGLENPYELTFFGEGFALTADTNKSIKDVIDTVAQNQVAILSDGVIVPDDHAGHGVITYEDMGLGTHTATYAKTDIDQLLTLIPRGIIEFILACLVFAGFVFACLLGLIGAFIWAFVLWLLGKMTNTPFEYGDAYIFLLHVIVPGAILTSIISLLIPFPISELIAVVLLFFYNKDGIAAPATEEAA